MIHLIFDGDSYHPIEVCWCVVRDDLLGWCSPAGAGNQPPSCHLNSKGKCSVLCIFSIMQKSVYIWKFELFQYYVCCMSCGYTT
ncbi:MAG: hypothetical protein ACI8RD_013637 [Bacillariaceae sp.]|jgi:hypothetical protein